jgi:multisubunit Na+/H+ antiporter MnhE subunit
VTIAVRTIGLAAIYLLVLTSLDPYDIAAGLLLGLVVSIALRTRGTDGAGVALTGGPRAIIAAMAATAREMVVGSWRVVCFCLRPGSAAPGFVEVPRDGRTRSDLALWGLLTGEAPDEVPVDIDEERDVLLVHLVDARDPDAVRARHRHAHERMERS